MPHVIIRRSLPSNAQALDEVISELSLTLDKWVEEGWEILDMSWNVPTDEGNMVLVSLRTLPKWEYHRVSVVTTLADETPPYDTTAERAELEAEGFNITFNEEDQTWSMLQVASERVGGGQEIIVRDGLTNELARLGREGWELVTREQVDKEDFVFQLFYFKRRL